MFSKLPLKYSLLLLFGTLVLTGCKTPLKQGWYNFNAYFNTYYNANLNFERGLEKNRNQKPELNPERPIRIHPPPNRAGQSEFENAIDKGAKILRDHENSKFVDDALLLIGRAYFYQSEFYNAEQKFRELYRTTDNQELYQRAVLWRGRVYLEMDRYQEGITFLQNELEGYEKEWEEEIRAEIRSVLAELFVQVDDPDAAIGQLTQALGRIDRNITSARAHFLQGQLLERKGEYEKAFQVYQKVDEFHPFYDLVYESRRKEAEMARNMKQYKKALELYTNMYRDDKNFEIRTELLYEIGKTQQEWERIEEAENTYKRVLHGEFQSPESVTRAKSYYGLAELNRWHYLDFKRAAAYYDSAASVSVDKERLPDTFNAPQMSESFGEYTKLRGTIQHQDSLLWLAELPQAKRDSVINVIRQKKLEKLKEQQKQRQESQSSMVNVEEKVSDVEQKPGSDSGFLNYKDEKSVTESKQKFSAVWGRRRLMDNWRRVEALRNTLSEQKGDSASQQQEGMSQQMRRRKLQVTVDVESIPFEEEDKEKARDKIAKSQYQLGNLFFLSLNMLDSAKTNYRKVIDNYSDHKISAQALYSLSELYYVNNDTAEARKWSDRLIEQWPNSRFAQRAKERFNLQQDTEALNVDEQDTLNNQFHHLYDSIRTSAGKAELSKGAEKLKQFAAKISESSLAPHALFESAKLYMQAAREDSVYQAKEKDWFEARESWQKKRKEFESLQDSANKVMQDTTLSDSLRTYWQGIADSSLTEPEFTESFPFLGAKWDTSRVLLSRIKENYPEFTFSDRINRLQETLELPSEFQESSNQKGGEDIPSMPPDSVTFYNCSQLQEELAVVGGVEKFMSNIQVPDTLKSEIEAAPDTLTYEVAIDTAGHPLKFKLVGEQDSAISSQLARFIENSMRKELQFEPLKEEGNPVFAICRFRMPLAFFKD